MMRVVVAAVLALLVSGCLTSTGGDGGDVVVAPGPAEAPGAWYAQGGSGTEGGLLRTPRDGCDVSATGATFDMCGTAWQVDNARFRVMTVDGEPIPWETLHVGVEEQGASVAVEDAQMALVHRINISDEVGLDRDVWVYDTSFEGLIDGDASAGDAFSLCGGGLNVWVRDTRDIGGIVGLIVDAAGCEA